MKGRRKSKTKAQRRGRRATKQKRCGASETSIPETVDTLYALTSSATEGTVPIFARSADFSPTGGVDDDEPAAHWFGLDADGHGRFRDLCLIYGDFYRHVFLEEILKFVDGAATAETELTKLRAAIRDRTARLRQDRRGRRGRPRAEKDTGWLRKAKVEAMQKYVLRWSWEKIAQKANLEPTTANIWTLQRRQKQYAELLMTVILPNEHGWDLERLKQNLESKPLQQWLSINARLPFREHPEDCRTIVLALVSPLFKLRNELYE